MQGDAQNKEISIEVIDRILDGTGYLNSLTLTGGEPSLNPKAIEYIAKQLSKRGIGLNHAYIATNGKEVSDEFMIACVKLFMLAEDLKYNGLALSQDMFHEVATQCNIDKLRTLAAFDGEAKKTDFDRTPGQNLGRAKNLSQEKCKEQYSDLEVIDRDGETIEFDGVCAITFDGDLLDNCDYEYADTSSHYLVNVMKDKDWVQTMSEAFSTREQSVA